MRKIAFVEPKSADFNVYARWMKHLPLLGPVYLGTILKNKDYSVKIFNENITKIDFNELKQYDFLALSIITSTAPRAYLIAQKYKKIRPDGKVMIGGAHATFMSTEAINYADYVVIGEAESVILDIVNEKYEPGIIQGKPVEKLDELPYPDLSLIKNYDEKQISPISTSRGCPFQCDFCSVSPMFGLKYRFRGTDSVIEELKKVKSKRVFFYDDNFTANKTRAKELLNKMIDEGLNLNWTAQVRADIYKDESLVVLMKKAGCAVLCMGFESVNNETLERFNKKQTVEDIKQCIDVLHKHGIKVHGMFLSEGFYDYSKLKLDTLQLCIETPLPGSRLFERIKEAKQFLEARNPLKNPINWKFFDGGHIVHIHKKFDSYQLQKQTIKAYKKFYSKTRMIKYFFITLFNWKKFYNFYFAVYGHHIFRRWNKRNKRIIAMLKKKPTLQQS